VTHSNGCQQHIHSIYQNKRLSWNGDINIYMHMMNVSSLMGSYCFFMAAFNKDADTANVFELTDDVNGDDAAGCDDDDDGWCCCCNDDADDELRRTPPAVVVVIEPRPLPLLAPSTATAEARILVNDFDVGMDDVDVAEVVG
jgi:hypothetical protein